MISAAELALARADAEREMPDRIRIKRRTGSALNPTTLIETPAYTTLHDNQPAIILRSRVDSDARQGGEPLSMTVFHVYVPADVTGVEDGDLVEVISSEDVDQPTLAVESTNAGSVTVARLLTCTELGAGLNDGDYPEETS